MVDVLLPPIRYLPTDITGTSLGILPNAEIIKTYVADPIECRDVRVLVSVKDRIFKDSNGRRVGYWYDNENISGILKLRVQFTTGTSSGGFFGALRQRASSYSATIEVTKENCINPLNGDIDLGGSAVVGNLGPTGDMELEDPGGSVGRSTGYGMSSEDNMLGGGFGMQKQADTEPEIHEDTYTFYFLLKLENPSNKNFPSYLSGFVNEIEQMKTEVYIDNTKVKEKYNTFQNIEVQNRTEVLSPKDINVMNKLPIYSNSISQEGLTNYEIQAPSAQTGNRRIFSDLKISRNKLGFSAGTFYIDLESLITRESSYSDWINTISENKRRDIISNIRMNHSNKIIDSIAITRTRVDESSQESISFSTPYEENSSEKLLFKTKGEKEIHNREFYFSPINVHLLQGNSDNFKHYTFVDRESAAHRGSRFKYRIRVESNIDNIIDTILRTGYRKFKQSLADIKNYHAGFISGNMLIPGTNFYNLQLISTNTAVGRYIAWQDRLIDSLSNIVDFLMNFNQSSQDASLETLRSLYTNMNPSNNPSIEVVAELITNLERIDSKICGFLFKKLKTGDKTDTGFSPSISDSRYKSNGVEKEFSETIKIEEFFNGLKYMPLNEKTFPLISLREYSNRVVVEKKQYQSNQSTGTNFYSHLTPHSYIREREEKEIKDFPILMEKQINDHFNLSVSKKNLIKQRSDQSDKILELPKIILEIMSGKKISTSFQNNLKDFFAKNKGVLFTAPTNEQSNIPSSNKATKRAVQAAKAQETRFYLNLLTNTVSETIGQNPSTTVSISTQGNKVTNLKGELQDIEYEEFSRKIPYHFLSFFSSPSERVRVISNAYSGGYGEFIYSLTLQRVCKIEYLKGVGTSGEEIWEEMSVTTLKKGDNKTLLCKVSPIQDDELGFKTDESVPIVNKYFMLGI